MKPLLYASLLWLGGCAGAAPAALPAPSVQVPLALPCRAPAVPLPTFATASVLASDSLQSKVRALLAERRERLAYESRLRAALAACR